MEIQPTPILKSKYKQEKEAKDLEIFNRFTELMAVQDAQVGPVNETILAEFPEVHATSTIWQIRKRVKKRLEAEEKEALKLNTTKFSKR